MSISQKASIYSFQDPVPSKLYWDARFIVSFASKNSKYHEDCANFLKILEKEKVTCVVSTLALDETWFVIIQAKIEEDFAPKSFGKYSIKTKKLSGPICPIWRD